MASDSENIEEITLSSDSGEETARHHTGSKKIKPKMASKQKEVATSSTEVVHQNRVALDSLVSGCLPHTKDALECEIIKKLVVLYEKGDTRYTHSQRFLDFTKTTEAKVQIEPTLMFVHLKEFFADLKACQPSKDKGKKRKNEEGSAQNAKRQSVEPRPVQTSPARSSTVQVVDDAQPSTSGLQSATTSTEEDHVVSSATGPDDIEGRAPGKNEKRIIKLEKILKALHKKIQKLNEAEHTLEDMEDSDSYYVLEDRYKTKIMQVWNKICELSGRDKGTGRVTERRFTFEASRYPEINKRIEKFINKYKAFPDFRDILQLVRSTNTNHSLHLRPNRVHEIAQEIFIEVGEKLQTRRIKDYQSTFGCHLVDDFNDDSDPANHDEELRRKLEENGRIGKQNTDKIMEHFVQRQHNEVSGSDTEGRAGPSGERARSGSVSSHLGDEDIEEARDADDSPDADETSLDADHSLDNTDLTEGEDEDLEEELIIDDDDDLEEPEARTKSRQGRISTTWTNESSRTSPITTGEADLDEETVPENSPQTSRSDVLSPSQNAQETGESDFDDDIIVIE